jgi:hypothetical protein
MERAALPHDDAVQRQLQPVDGGMIPGVTLPDIAKLTAVAGQIAGDVAAVAGRVEVAFDTAAAAELRTSIRNFATLSTVLAGAVRAHAGDLDTMSTNLQAAVRSLNRTARTTEQLAARVDSSATSGDWRRLMTDLGSAAAELRATTATLSGMSKELAGTQARPVPAPRGLRAREGQRGTRDAREAAQRLVAVCRKRLAGARAPGIGCRGARQPEEVLQSPGVLR